jgi:gamma-glutamyltranspeptidase/glutathione hydrolase
MPRSAVAAVASDGHVAEAAAAALARGGTAIDACIAAFMAHAGLRAGGLLGPVHILVAGPGVGARAYDGSALQPGRGAPRPRGYRPIDVVPDVARVAISPSIALLSLAHAHDGRLPVSELCAAGVRLAQAAGAAARSELLRRLGAGGILAARDGAFSRALLEVAGRAAGGNLTAADVQEAAALVERPVDNAGVLRLAHDAGFAAEAPEARDARVLETVVACACDARGVLAALHAAHDPLGPEVPALEIAAPRLAVPVRRGVPRLRPGARLPSAAPIALLLDRSVPWAAVAVQTRGEVDWERLRVEGLGPLALEQALRGAALRGPSARAAVAVVRAARAGGGARAVHLTPAD